MKKALCLLLLLSGFVASANQIIYTTTPEDFNPIKKSDWKVLVGSTAVSFSTGNSDTSGRGLGLAIEKNIMQNIGLGFQYANIRANTTEKLSYETIEYTEGINAAAAYGKFSFVNYSINKWNLLQLNVLGGLSLVENIKSNPQIIYGAAMAYNYDNLLGFEVDTKINTKAEPMTSASFIGYF